MGADTERKRVLARRTLLVPLRFAIFLSFVRSLSFIGNILLGQCRTESETEVAGLLARWILLNPQSHCKRHAMRWIRRLVRNSDSGVVHNGFLPDKDTYRDGLNCATLLL